MTFTCSICGEASMRICVRCTKDACSNHLCLKCGRCSDCCECEVRLEDAPPVFVPVAQASLSPQPDSAAEPAAEPPVPGPEPDPAPAPAPEPPSETAANES